MKRKKNDLGPVPDPDQFRVTAPAKEGHNWTWEKRVEICTKYMALGNMRLISEQTKIPYDTLLSWKQSSWWPDLVEEIKKTRKMERVSKLSRLVDRSLETIEDRLENGDWVFDNKRGEAVRKPVSLRDATAVAKDILRHQTEQEQIIDRVQRKEDSIQETLKLLADEFKKWTRREARNNAETIEFNEVNDALHEERETRLQEGSEGVYEPSGSSREASGAEQSSQNDGESREG